MSGQERPEDLRGLRAIVTGGASGIGAAIADRLEAHGVAVAVFDRDVSALTGDRLAIRVDVTDDASVRAGVEQAAAALGGIDIVINNAGVGAQGNVEANDDDEWHRVYDVNVVGIARVSRAALPHLRKSPSPVIVNTASVAAHTGLPDRALYTATKGAVAALTRAMAADHLHEGIRVNSVSPGTAATPWVERLLEGAEDPAARRAALEARQPHGRLVSAREVADAVVYLAHPQSGSTNGIDLSVDGGLSTVQVPKR